MKFKLFAVLSVVVSLSACVKAPSYPIIPAIEFKSVSSSIYEILYYSPNNIVYPSDTIILSFTDGDGDIGYSNIGIDSCNFCDFKNGDTSCFALRGFNVFMIDSRDSCILTKQTPDIESAGRYKAVSGEIQIILAIDMKNSGCFIASPSCPIDTLSYSIFIKDKAGHMSNVVQTTKIVAKVVQQ